MKQHGKAKILKAADWPSFVETVRPIYEDFEMYTTPADAPLVCDHFEATEYAGTFYGNGQGAGVCPPRKS